MNLIGRTAGLLAAAAALCGAVALPGVGAQDPREAVDAGRAPWSALARVNIAGVSRCTAVLVAPRLALTAAHCIYAARLGHFAPASAIHVLVGYAGGVFAGHTVAVAVRIAAGYDPAQGKTPASADAALLTLAAALSPPAETLALADAAPGDKIMLGGYSQDHAELIFADRDCHVLAIGPRLLRHDCAATRGVSGGPLIGAGNRVVGLAIAGRNGQAGGIAVSAAVLRGLLAAE